MTYNFTSTLHPDGQTVERSTANRERLIIPLQ
jgi:hypothetical protein